MSRWLFILLVAVCLRAQSPLGTVTGLAVDPASSSISDATVSLLSIDTGVKRDTVTNPSGAYTFPNLPPGRYKLSANAKGFRPLETPEFSLAAYRTIRQDLRFQLLANVTEVTVTEAISGVITTESPSIATSLSSKQILELPTNLRSVFNNAGDSGLIFSMMPLTIPGVVQVGAGAAWLVPGAGQNGIRLQVDGIETNFGNFGLPDPVTQPSFEAVDEFTANVNSNRAEFGGIGNITTVTRAGTNAYHGNVFWYARNSAFDARNAFQSAKPFQNIHNFGASMGGPLRKDKTFFYAVADFTRGSRAYLFNSSVPTLAQRAGDFGAAVVRNPFTNQPFEGNRIPASLISQSALRAQQTFFPLPNFGAPTLTAGNYRDVFNGPESHRILELRLDHNFERQSAFLRYQNKDHDFEIPGVRSELPPQSVGTSVNIRSVHFFTLGHTTSLTPNIFNEARAGVVVLASKSDSDVKGQTLLDSIGIRGLSPRPGINGVPNINIAGVSLVTQRLLNPVNDGRWQLSDNLTWARGRHTMKFGVEVVRWFVNRHMPVEANVFGNFSFTSRFSGNAYADFLLGLPNTVTKLDPYLTQYSRWTNFAWYAQDDFKLAPRLTLSYGIRYEYNGPITIRDDNFYSFNPANGSLIVPSQRSLQSFSAAFPRTVPVTIASDIGLPRSLRNADKNNFAPRVGFSYQADNRGRTIVRGGLGIYYAPYSGAVTGSLAAGPYSLSATSTNAITNGVAAFTFENPFLSPSAPGTLNLNGISPNLINSYTMQYSLSIEREILTNLGLRISYIASRGVNLPFQRNINQPPASLGPARRPFTAFNNLIYAENGAYSSYSGLQAQVTRRFSRGLQFSSAWTWSKQIAEVDDTGNAELNTTIENAFDRRRDRADVYAMPRHQWMNQALWALPGKGLILGGWQLNFLVNLQTGNFLNPALPKRPAGGMPNALRSYQVASVFG